MDSTTSTDALWTLQVQIIDQNPEALKDLGELVAQEKKEKQQDDPNKKKHKWTTTLDQPVAVDRNAPVSDLATVDFKTIKVLERSEKGSEGLFFVETESGLCIVKRSSNVGSEIFASLLALHLGIAAPKVRILDMEGPEGDALFEAIRNPKIDPSGRAFSILARQKFLILMEYVKGLSLREVDHNLAAKLFATSTPAGRKLVQDIGSMIALDVLTNNGDRMPLIWQNDGNLGNVFITGKAVSIDAKVFPIDQEKQLELRSSYLRKVEDLVEALLQDSSKELPQFKNVRMNIQVVTGHDIGEEGSIALQEGFLNVVKKTANVDIAPKLKSWFDILAVTEPNPLILEFIAKIWSTFQDPSKKTTVVESPKPAKDSSNQAVPAALIPPGREFVWNKVLPATDVKPSPRRYAKANLYQNKMYVFGGTLVTKASSQELFCLDLAKKTWTLVKTNGSCPARCGHTQVVHNNKLWVFGGLEGKNALSDTWTYDFESNQWEEVKTESGPSARFHQASHLINGKLYIFGGSANIKKHMNDTWQFDFEEKKWTQLQVSGNIPSERTGPISFVVGDKMYIYGGQAGEGGYTLLCDTYVFDPVTLKWEEREDVAGSLPRCGRPLEAVVDANGIVFVYGGYDGKKPVDGCYEFSASTGKWSFVKLWLELELTVIASAAVGSKGMTPTPRYGSTAVIDERGLITIFGGSGSMYLDDTLQIDTVDDEDEDE